MGQIALTTKHKGASIMAKATNPDEAAAAWAGILLDKADELREQYAGLLTQRNANRQDLRNMAEQGFLSDEELQHMNEVYPPRKRNADEADELDEAFAEAN